MNFYDLRWKFLLFLCIVNEAPPVMCDCIEFLRSHGLKHMKSFRFVGNVDVINDLKARYKAELRIGLQSLKARRKMSALNLSRVSVKDVGSLLLEFLRGIKGGLLSPRITIGLVQVMKKKLEASVCSLIFNFDYKTSFG